jgi:flagellar hook-associated protein 1 FlgK
MGINFSAKILNNAVSSLHATQGSIGNISNNIANVNTEGYSRRVLGLENRQSRNVAGGLDIGNGVSITGITRISDKFIEETLRVATSDSYDADAQQEILARVEQLFSLTGETNTIGGTLTAFFDSLDNLTLDPSSIELRSEVIERATDLVETIQYTYNGIAELQDEADQRIASEINTVNALTAEIADLNNKVQAKEAAGNVAADERDQRDLLVKRLSEKIGFELVETSDGGYNIYLANGFTLVNGSTSRDLEAVAAPSFAAAPPASLSGGQLSYIVYDYDTTGASPSHVDLTSMLRDAGGSIGGLLTVRGVNPTTATNAFDADGPLVALASRVEAITQQLLVGFNTTYLGPDRDGTNLVHDASSVDLDGNTPSVFGFFTFAYTGTRDADSDGLPSGADLTAAMATVNNFSSLIALTSSDPRDIAAARDLSGGAPAALSYAPGDGQNLEALVALQSQSYTYSVGNYTATSTLNQVYNETVNYISNEKSRVDIQSSILGDQLVTAQAARDSESAVSLDEEFTNLIKFQKSFQASSRLIRVASEILDTIVSII